MHPIGEILQVCDKIYETYIPKPSLINNPKRLWTIVLMLFLKQGSMLALMYNLTC